MKTKTRTEGRLTSRDELADEDKKFEEKLRRRRLLILKKQLQEPMRPTTVINLSGKHIKPSDVSVRMDGEIIVRNQWIYIGREVPWCRLYESDWRNPFKLPWKHTPEQRAEVIWKYEHEHLASRPDLLARLPMLKGQTLCCWCAPEPRPWRYSSPLS